MSSFATSLVHMSPYTSLGVTLTVLLMSSSAPQANGFDVNGYWTYSPSFEAMSGIKGIRKIGSHEDNLFLIPERNSFKIGNVTIYQCKMCDYRSRKPNEYVTHAKEKHFFPGHEKNHQWIMDLAKRQDHNYSCNVCNETYKSEMALLWHITKYDHVLDDHDEELCTYLRARIQLNETFGRKVVYHQLARPFYKVKEPKNESDAESEELNELVRGYHKATYIPGVDISSGDISNPNAHDDICKLGISKYQKEDVEKRFKKINGVNVYQRSPEEQEYAMTDETAEQARLASQQARLDDRRARRKAYAEQDTGELLAKEEREEEEESAHSASFYRRQIEEYGPWASHSDKVGDRQEKKKTTKVIIKKRDKNRRNSFSLEEEN